ncbi:nucleotide-binding universal stress UspA family protein [Methylobacterium sp. BE186]|uniref:universal stress protein n=1 Tax=Methylobacterium sp. BE186 TaxID=2817715 RepID=UPI0028627A9F|nr:universal stress protein [Methylobacterium sp. BE186]MDR7036049.1 nucleotide-binding universal stress UspA family protein [Methylobacterium sp. BE186]
MSIASVMVSADLGTGAAERVRLAASLASRFEATLTGVAARKIPDPGPGEDLETIRAAYRKEQAKLTEDLTQCREIFEQSCGAEIRTTWRQAEADASSFLVRQALAADIVVVGRGKDAAGGLAISLGAVLMEVGRPVLVTPPVPDHLKAERIVVAWKDTPEARRAVSAALPFLRCAKQVYVVSAGEEARFEGAEQVSEFLGRHGAQVVTHLLNAATGDVADEILQFTTREDADLLVMGGYGHSRLREWLFGGVTRDILQTASVCCLMSH